MGAGVGSRVGSGVGSGVGADVGSVVGAGVGSTSSGRGWQLSEKREGRFEANETKRRKHVEVGGKRRQAHA